MIDNCRKSFVLVRLDYPLNFNKKTRKLFYQMTQSGWAAAAACDNCYFHINKPESFFKKSKHGILHSLNAATI